jgi:hypothetical protein
VDRIDEAALRHRKQTETFPMLTKKPRAEKQRKLIKRKIIKKKKHTAIFEEVQNFEDLGTRMQELLLTSPKGTRIYLRVRKDTTIN